MLTGVCSCWSVLCFVWLSGFHRRDKAAGTEQTTGCWRAPGQRAWIETANTLQIPQMPFHCACLFISIYPCVRACPSVVMSFCVHNRQLLVYLFFIASLAEVFDSCSLLCWHRVTQLGRYNRSQTWGSRLAQHFLIWRRFRSSIPPSNPGFLHSLMWGGRWIELVCASDFRLAKRYWGGVTPIDPSMSVMGEKMIPDKMIWCRLQSSLMSPWQ